jgi:6-pyruvoyltetrahydropterin/6-carboxytetrahydropterin synthase
MYLSTKTYGTDRGLSCCFRQWGANSHCNQAHGYALGFRFVFAARELDHRNWVVDFGPGGVGEIKKYLERMFDHTFLIAENDPKRAELEALGEAGIADVRIVPAVGCEATAKMVYDFASELITRLTNGRCWVESVECFEHGANSAIYRNPKLDYVVDHPVVNKIDSWNESWGIDSWDQF